MVPSPVGHPRAFILLAGLLSAVFSVSSSAAGFRLPNQDAFATSRGSAFVAAANNASAVYYNPAGLNQLDRQELRGGTYSIRFAIEHERVATQYSNMAKWQFAPQLFYANPATELFSWGVGLYSPFGLGNDWGSGTPFETVTRKARIEYVTLAPVGAWQVNDQLDLGFGLTLNRVKADVRQGVGVFPGDSLTFLGDDTGVGYTASLLYRPFDEHRFGLTWRSGVSHELRGRSSISFAGIADNSGLDLDIPGYWVAGYAWQATAATDIEINVERAGWSSLDISTLSNTALGDLPFPFGWQDGYIYELGLSHRRGDLIYSVGYDLNESVQGELFYNPAVSDTDSHWLNFGVAHEGEQLQWALSWQYGRGDRTVENALTNAAGENANGEYRMRALTMQATLGWRF